MAVVVIHRLLALVAAVVLLASCCSGGTPAKYASHGFIERLNDATIAIVERGSDGKLELSCGGVWIGEDLIATAAHCLETAGMGEIDKLMHELAGEDYAYDPTGKTVEFVTYRAASGLRIKEIPEADEASIIAYDRKQDLALMRASKPHPHSVVAIGGRPWVGDNLVVIGHSAGFPFSMSSGVVGGVRHMDNARDVKSHLIQVAASSTYFGNSGGGAFNGDGELIGICSFLVKGSGLSFFVATEELVTLMVGAHIEF
jgi:V8-like Glu-specific endopeptidase